LHDFIFETKIEVTSLSAFIEYLEDHEDIQQKLNFLLKTFHNIEANVLLEELKNLLPEAE